MDHVWNPPIMLGSNPNAVQAEGVTLVRNILALNKDDNYRNRNGAP